MNRRKAKKYLCVIAAVMAVMTTSGCSKLKQVELTEEEKALCVEYAANAVLKHDKNYIDRMRSVEMMTEAPTEVSSQQQTSAGTTTETMPNGGETPTEALVSMNELLGISGLDIQPAGFEVAAAYPSNGTELGMSMIAVKGSKLLVLKFHVTNTTQAEIPLDLLNLDVSYKGVINGSVRMNAQKTALLDAFNTFKGAIPAGSTQDMVLVFEVNENDTNNISSVELNVTYNGRQGTVAMN